MNERRIRYIQANDVQPKHTKWIVYRRFVAGLNLIAGPPGVGKGLIAALLAGRFSNEEKFCPDCEPNKPANVVLLSDEDDLESQHIPRLMVVNARMEKVFFMKGALVQPPNCPVTEAYIDMAADLPGITKDLEDGIIPPGSLIIIDPVTNHIGGNTNPYHDVAVRKLLTPWNNLGMRYNVAVIIVLHLNKKEDLSAVNRVGGAGAWVNVPRISWLVVGDPNDKQRSYFLSLKPNILRKGEGSWSFDIKTAKLTFDGQSEEYAYAEWVEPVTMSADEALISLTKQMQPKRRASKYEKALEICREILTNGDRKVTDLEQIARDEGISMDTLESAKRELGIESKKVEGGWFVWRAPGKRNKKGS